MCCNFQPSYRFWRPILPVWDCAFSMRINKNIASGLGLNFQHLCDAALRYLQNARFNDGCEGVVSMNDVLLRQWHVIWQFITWHKMTENATHEWLPVNYGQKEHLKSTIFPNICGCNVTRNVVNCVYTATNVINAIYLICYLTGRGMSQTPTQESGSVDSPSLPVPGVSTLETVGTSLVLVEPTTPSPRPASSTDTANGVSDEAAEPGAARKRSSRFSRAFALLPIPKPKLTNVAKAKLSESIPLALSQLVRMTPATSESFSTSSDTSKTSTSSPFRGVDDGMGEFDFLSRPFAKRSVSLKSQSIPPGTVRAKKVVRFADALGLDLASVCHITDDDELPHIPECALRNLGLQSYEPLSEDCYLMPLFSQPACLPNFFSAVRSSKVLLENCLVNDGSQPSVSGTVRVANIGYTKDVVIHYSTDRWLSCQDLQATYVMNSTDGQTDRFSFHITLPYNFVPGSRLQLAVRYSVEGQTFWDNNHGKDYVVECYGPTPSSDQPSWMNFFWTLITSVTVTYTLCCWIGMKQFKNRHLLLQ